MLSGKKKKRIHNEKFTRKTLQNSENKEYHNDAIT